MNDQNHLARTVLLGFVALSQLFLNCGCQRASSETAAKETREEIPQLRAVVLAVEPQVWPKQVTVQGSLIADEVAVVGAQVAGRVESVLVDLGDRIKAGEALVKLDEADFQLRIDQAEAELAQSRAAVGLAPGQSLETLNPKLSPPVLEQKATWDEARTRSARINQLYEQNAVTDTDLETAIAAEEVAAAKYDAALNAVNEKLAMIGVRSAALALAKQHLSEAVITAPFDCLVQEKHVAPGNYVQIGESLVTVVRADPLRFRGTVPERFAQQVQIGQTLRLQIDSTGKRREVQITRISPSLDMRSRALTFEAEVQNTNGKLRNGLFTQGEIILNPEAEQLVVPKSAIVEFAGVEKVWKVVEGLAQEQVIQTGERRGGAVEILTGLKPGDVILLEGETGKVAHITPLRDNNEKVDELQTLAKDRRVADKDAEAEIDDSARTRCAAE